MRSQQHDYADRQDDYPITNLEPFDGWANFDDFTSDVGAEDE